MWFFLFYIYSNGEDEFWLIFWYVIFVVCLVVKVIGDFNDGNWYGRNVLGSKILGVDRFYCEKCWYFICDDWGVAF